ncbi:hypothetical protein EAG_11121 [Camponotus floridanus]|uniref:Uncharacterized protein n=1 Tax=Camponotus floridanus TaxID=104421 RepID=E1ZW88_CAMFO|nr:hypothetical protein EAG_11121 [Camponotus floridanus]
MVDFRHRISTAKSAQRKKEVEEKREDEVRAPSYHPVCDEIFDPHVCPQMMSAHRVCKKSPLENNLRDWRIRERQISGHLPHRCPLLLHYLVTQPDIPPGKWRSLGWTFRVIPTGSDFQV